MAIVVLATCLLMLTCCKKDKDNNPTSSETIKDIDGNVYHTVTIGKQVWMKENLKVTHYRNGKEITNVVNDLQWQYLTTGAYVWFDYDITNKNTYAALYNWDAVNDSSNLAPIGWHVPSDEEWSILADALGGNSMAGKLLETGIKHWASPNNVATNSSGFTALPCGSYGTGTGFNGLGTYTYFWSSTMDTPWRSWMRALHSDDPTIHQYTKPSTDCCSVRCVKN